MKPSYQTVDRKGSQGFSRYFAKNGQLLLPLVELVEAFLLALVELEGQPREENAHHKRLRLAGFRQSRRWTSSTSPASGRVTG
jgi:hypothetical protein